jgi:subtilisin
MLDDMTTGTGRRARTVLVVLVLLAAPLVAGPLTGPAQAGATSPARPGAPAGAVDVIVSFDDDLAPPARMIAGAAAGGNGATVFAAGSGFAASLTVEQIAQLRALPGIAAVTPNRRIEPAAEHLDRTGVTTAWRNGLRGDGQSIVVIDTGVDTTNPNLARRVVAEACFTAERPPAGTAGAATAHAVATTTGRGDCPDGSIAQFGPGAAAPCTGRPECSHGTAVASVAAADGPDVWGAAPGASVIAVQVFSSVRDAADRVLTDEASLVRALEWVEQLRRTRPVAAVNLSLGGAPVATPCTASPALTSVIERLSAVGTAVVASAGNQGSDTMLSFPACLPQVVSVGAEGTPGAPADFTNRSPWLSLFAPGDPVAAAWSAPCCTRTVSGTSFAAPQVAAAFALLAQHGGHGTIAEQLALLQRTGRPVLTFGTSGWEPVDASALDIDRALDRRYDAPGGTGVARRASPFGFVDVVEPRPGGIRVAGWSIDPDTVVPVTVHVYVDGLLTIAVPANVDRPDVGAAYPGHGAAHGFDEALPLPPGRRTVCVYGIDIGPGDGNVLLECRTVDTDRALGALDTVTAVGAAVQARGWAINPLTAAAVEVTLEIDGRPVARTEAASSRPDVAVAYPGYGPQHGYTIDAPAEPGTRRVCVTVRDTPIGCRSVAVEARPAPPAPQQAGPPAARGEVSAT